VRDNEQFGGSPYKLTTATLSVVYRNQKALHRKQTILDFIKKSGTDHPLQGDLLEALKANEALLSLDNKFAVIDEEVFASTVKAMPMIQHFYSLERARDSLTIEAVE